MQLLLFLIFMDSEACRTLKIIDFHKQRNLIRGFPNVSLGCGLAGLMAAFAVSETSLETFLAAIRGLFGPLGGVMGSTWDLLCENS